MRARDEFEQVFRATYTRQVRDADSLVHDLEVAEDVVRETFVDLRRHWGRITAYERPDAYVGEVVALRVALMDKPDAEYDDATDDWLDVDAALAAVLADHRAVRRRQALLAFAAFVVVVVVIALVAVVRERMRPEPVTYDAVTGTYVSKIGRAKGVPDDLVGSWTVMLNGMGGLTLVPPSGYDGAVEGHGYSLSGATLETTVFSERPDCRRTQGLIGVYRVKRDHRDLRFDLVRDTCAARRALFAGRWSKQAP